MRSHERRAVLRALPAARRHLMAEVNKDEEDFSPEDYRRVALRAVTIAQMRARRVYDEHALTEAIQYAHKKVLEGEIT